MILSPDFALLGAGCAFGCDGTLQYLGRMPALSGLREPKPAVTLPIAERHRDETLQAGFVLRAGRAAILPT